MNTINGKILTQHYNKNEHTRSRENNKLIQNILLIHLDIKNNIEFRKKLNIGILDLTLIDRSAANCLKLTLSFYFMLDKLSIGILRGLTFFWTAYNCNGKNLIARYLPNVGKLQNISDVTKNINQRIIILEEKITAFNVVYATKINCFNVDQRPFLIFLEEAEDQSHASCMLPIHSLTNEKHKAPC